MVTTKALESLGLKGVKFSTHLFRIGEHPQHHWITDSEFGTLAFGHVQEICAYHEVLNCSLIVIFSSYRCEWPVESTYLWPQLYFWGCTLGQKKLGLSCWLTIEWKGRRGMQWPGLLPLLFRELKGPKSHVIVVHLGGNDLGLVKGKALIIQAKEDFAEIQRQWPGVLIVWLAMVPRRVWKNAIWP